MTFWRSFWKFTTIVLILLVVVFAIAWHYTPAGHPVRIAGVLYGFLLGWLAAWWNRWWYTRKQPKQ